MDRQKGGCFASFQIVSFLDVDCEGDHVVNVYVINTPWVYIDVHYELILNAKGDIIPHGFGGGGQDFGWGNAVWLVSIGRGGGSRWPGRRWVPRRLHTCLGRGILRRSASSTGG